MLWHDPAEPADVLAGRRPRPRRRRAVASPGRGGRRTASRSRGRRSRSSRSSSRSASTTRTAPPTRPSPTPSRRPTRRRSRRPAATSFHQAPVPVAVADPERRRVPVSGADYELEHGSVVIAAITSCTNTSNPQVMVAAGLLAKKAVERGLARKPWVKSSLAPGSKVVTRYYEQAGLQRYLDELGFNTVGYGCTTCIGNSGPAPRGDLRGDRRGRSRRLLRPLGNRNFEARIHPDVKANYLASPPLVVAYALAGRMDIELGDGAGRRRTATERRCTSATSGRRRRRSATRSPRPSAPSISLRLRGRLHRRRRVAYAARAGRRALRVGSRLDLRAPAAVLRRDAARRGHRRGRRGCALPCHPRRLGHDRPHLARGLDPARLARRSVPASSTASSGATSTRTARGEGTTR